MSKREKTVRLSLAGAALTLFAGLWGALYQHDKAQIPDPGASQPEAMAGLTLPVAVAPQPSTQSIAGTQPAPVTQPAPRVHTRTRAS